MTKNWWDGYELTPRKAELKACAGVYKIICKATGEIYVGSGQDVSHRIRQHFNRLMKRSHDNAAMQAAWNAHGKDAFDWEIVFELPADLDQPGRFEHEERVMRSFDAALLFNVTYPASRKNVRRR